MEQKLNIAEILKDKPVELKLYSSTFGYIKFNGVHKDKVYFSSEDTNVHSVKSNGKMYDSGECIIFPSKKMRDWSKFAWKKGDVLTNSSGFKVFFDKWVNEDYTKFLGKIKVLGDSHYYYYDTAYYILASKKEALEFIKSVEEINNGKLNLKTLEIEKGQPEFKDGDIVVAEEDNYYDKVIFIATIKDDIVSKALINVRYEDYEVHYNEYRFGHNRSLRLATEEEKQQLFDALAKEGKRWDIEKKQIVDLKLKWTPKPFDKVVVRCGKADKWSIDFFSYKVSNGYICTGDAWFGYCLPYNEETAHLLGTTDDWEGGEQ
jgi:hypothetical protein